MRDPLHAIDGQAYDADPTPIPDDIESRPDKYSDTHRLTDDKGVPTTPTMGELKAQGYLVPKRGESGAQFYRRVMQHLAQHLTTKAAKPSAITEPPPPRADGSKIFGNAERMDERRMELIEQARQVLDWEREGKYDNPDYQHTPMREPGDET